jgi:aspartyl-tRNA(Asn)/glutamyl-tRNA(Gln) amidotransferase subunit A
VTASPGLRELSASEIAAAVSRAELDPLEMVDEHLAAIYAQSDLHAVLAVCGERARTRARGRLKGALAGVPILVKDIIDTEGVTTTYGSAMFVGHIPARTAQAVLALEQAGAVVSGKCNLREFAWGKTSQNPHFGTVGNPVRPGRIAGGSSGGNAAALAARMCTIGLASDTGGSARGPAACCSTVGFKPRLGTISTTGSFPLAPSLVTLAPMARSVADCELAYSVLAGRLVRSEYSARLTSERLGLSCLWSVTPRRRRR